MPSLPPYTKAALVITVCLVSAVFGVTKFMETEEVLWMVLALPLFAIVLAAV